MPQAEGMNALLTYFMEKDERQERKERERLEIKERKERDRLEFEVRWLELDRELHNKSPDRQHVNS